MNWRTKLISIFAFLGIVAGPLLLPLSSLAAVSSWQKGVSLYPRWNEDFSSQSFRDSVLNAKKAGVNFATLIIPWYQSNNQSTDIQRGGNTPTDAALVSAIDFIHSQGMAVNLKPHLDNMQGTWRAGISASDRATWYANYGAMLNTYADIGRLHGVEEITVGTELIGMSAGSGNAPGWRGIIAGARQRFAGKLTYSANWGPSGFADEKNNLLFWDALDSVGISAYFELTHDCNNSVEFLKSAWGRWEPDISALASRTGKPIQFLEIGYKSVPCAHTRPWDYFLGGAPDQNEQANDYEALFSFWNDRPYFAGVHLWDWSTDPNAGGGGTDYTPQHKLAEAVMTKWFGSAAPAPQPTPAPAPQPAPQPAPGTTGTPAFTSSAAASPGNPAVGQSTTITANFTNTGQASTGDIMDIEVYNSASAKVFQQFFENQTWNAGESRSFTATWTPSATGAYAIKLGAFNFNWTQNFHWNDTAGSINVGGTAPAPEPAPQPTPQPAPQSTLNIWWPTDGGTISGVQPFKAMLSNRDITTYDMFWQVDGDQLNLMANSAADFPHKESLVDVSGWSWKGAGPYQLMFTAKEFSGSPIAQKIMNIFVAH